MTMNTMNKVDSFVYWTSEKKGGVCALCLGGAVSYATHNPDKNVIAVDLDQKATLSAALLHVDGQCVAMQSICRPSCVGPSSANTRVIWLVSWQRRSAT